MDSLLIFCCHIFFPFHVVHGVLRARIVEWFAIPSSKTRTTFCQNSPLWPIHHGWLCTVWLIASLSYTIYTIPFAMTRLWSMKGVEYSSDDLTSIYALQNTLVYVPLNQFLYPVRSLFLCFPLYEVQMWHSNFHWPIYKLKGSLFAYKISYNDRENRH